MPLKPRAGTHLSAPGPPPHGATSKSPVRQQRIRNTRHYGFPEFPRTFLVSFVYFNKQDSAESLYWFPHRAGDLKTGAIFWVEERRLSLQWVCRMSRHHSAGASCPREAGLMSQRGRSVQLLRREVGVATSVRRASGLAVLCLSLQVVLKEATGKITLFHRLLQSGKTLKFTT